MKQWHKAGTVLLLVVAAYCVGSHSRHDKSSQSSSARKVLYYVDPMNPAHISEKPGKAPCGMDMEPVYADAVPGTLPEAARASLSPRAVRVTPEQQQISGIRVGCAEEKSLQRNVRLLGKVATDETRIYRVNATVDGWISKTFPVSIGSHVQKDETLARFYSPDVLTAGQSLLLALSSADRLKTTPEATQVQRNQAAGFDYQIRQYRDALWSLGMGQKQIDELSRTRKLLEAIDINSPVDGFVVERNVSDGQRFEKGSELFRVADLSHVWILMDVFEQDASLIQTGQLARIELPHQGKTFTASFSDTLPQFDNISRTLKVRLEVENADFTLKPDMFVDVELPVSLPKTIVVPTEAVLDTGLRQVVFVEVAKGYFEPRDVKLGSRVGDEVQVTQGLSSGQRIATCGAFLIDSESRMTLPAEEKGRSARDCVCGMNVDEATARAGGHLSDFRGITYFFCSDTCKRKFESKPANWLAQATQQPISRAEPAGSAP